MNAPSGHEIPDPLAFAADALAAQGALVERSGDECVGILPEALARSLEIPEACTLIGAVAADRVDAVACGLGSPLFERLTRWASARAPTASLRLAAEAPRPSQARALVERFPLRNAVFDIEQTTPTDATYVIGWFAWRAEADDRYDGQIVLAMHAADGAEPDGALVSLANPAHEPHRLQPEPCAGVGRAPLGLLARRAALRVREAIAPARAAVARRHARDHRRIAEYFAALIEDARSPKRRVEAAAIANKIEHMVSERDAKLRDLGQRYAMRVLVEPLALVSLALPAVSIRLRVRRRKREGELVLRLPAGAAALDRPACAACGGAAARPALCDDALHVLCETCVPHVQGRPECAAC